VDGSADACVCVEICHWFVLSHRFRRLLSFCEACAGPNSPRSSCVNRLQGLANCARVNAEFAADPDNFTTGFVPPDCCVDVEHYYAAGCKAWESYNQGPAGPITYSIPSDVHSEVYNYLQTCPGEAVAVATRA
jgi:hypothetical protein